MIYSKAMPYKQAIASNQVKTLLPTGLSSKQLSEIRPEILERARFSSKVRLAGHLSIIDDGTHDLSAGKIDLATARLRVKQFLKSTGYVPPEEKRGGLEDFSSDRRIDLQLLTTTQQAQGYGWWKQGQDQDILFAFPATEFLRVESREKPREDWPERWNAARAATTADGATDSRTGVMVALKGHPIWIELNRFKVEYEPFDFGSGMGTEDRSRADAIKLGLLDKDTVIFPQDRPFNADLKSSEEVRSKTLRSLLEQSGVGKFKRGVFEYTGGDE